MKFLLFLQADEASEYLLNMRPFQMKLLLRQILSGKEFVICNSSEGVVSVQGTKMNKHTMRDDLVTSTKKQDESFDRQGQWIRRRRLDGALNRVPMGFYPRAWRLLRRVSQLPFKMYAIHICSTGLK